MAEVAETSFDEAELRRLALAYVAGTVYTSVDVPDDLVLSVFMPVLFGSADQFKNIHMFVAEYGKHACSGRCVNGYPIFFECLAFTKATTDRFAALVKEAAAFLNPPEQPKEATE